MRIITDSTSDFTIEEAKNNNIDIVSLYVVFDGKNYKDKIDLDSEKFYELLKHSQPQSSQPSPSDFLEVYNRYPDEQILCITCSSKLSGTYQSAVIAKKGLDTDKIVVMDSATISLGLKNLVLQAIKMRDSGMSLEEIVREIDSLKDRVFVGGVANTLEYLKRGGRVSNIKALAGSVLKIKPLLFVEDGVLKSYKKRARGMVNALKILSQTVDEFKIDKNFPILLGYSKDDSNARDLAELFSKNGLDDNLSYAPCEVGSVISTHTGPNCVIFSFFSV